MFKTLEVGLKGLIKTAYPNTNTKDFYVWENMVDFFKQKNIKIHELDGYQEAIELKKLNNNFKHSETFGEEIKKIREFREQNYFDCAQLEAFCDRIIPIVGNFQNKMGEAVIKDLYEFGDERLDHLVKDFAIRMDKSTAKVFAKKLLDNYKK